MTQPVTDRNVLLGDLALRLNLLSAESLATARSEWQSDPTRSLGQILVARGLLSERALVALEALVAIQLNADDVKNAPCRDQATLETHASSTPSVDLFATRPPAGAEEADRAAGAGRSRYRVLRPHAKGGLGEVFVALDEELQREVALKEIQARYADSAESRQRFLLEGEFTGRLEHPGIVPVYGLGAYADGRLYYAMRFIRGDSLKDAIDRFHADANLKANVGKRGLELRQLLGRFVAVCNAVAYAHSKGVLHRDLKPDNVMLGKYGETLVVDWGLAKAIGAKEETTATGSVTLRPRSGADSGLTAAGSVLGTPPYMSPEQAAGQNAELGPASDVYSLGATLYNLLAGKAPFAGGDPYAILERVVRGLFPPPRATEPSVPQALEAVCLKAMALRPEDRYGSAKELADDIERWLSDEPVSAYKESWRLRLARWRRRHPALTTGMVAVVFVALAALGVGSLLLSQEKDRTLKEEQEKLAEQDRARVAQYERDLAQKERNLAQINSLLLDPHLLPARVPVLRDLGDKAVVLLVAELDRKPGPDWTESQRDALAQRQANAAVALLRLGKTERVWPLLQSGPYPDVRTYLLHRAGPLGVEAKLLWERLTVEKYASVRQALILALGEYKADQVPAKLRQEWTKRLLLWYREDLDAGVHAAIDWLLSHDKEGPQPRLCDWGDWWRADEEAGRPRGKRPIGEELLSPGRIDRTLRPRRRADRQPPSRLQEKVYKGNRFTGPRWYVNCEGQTMVLFSRGVGILGRVPRQWVGHPEDLMLTDPTVDHNFAIASKKVTVEQFGRFLDDHREVNRYTVRLSKDDKVCPIVGVTWYEAAQYCRWLSEQERIPEDQMCYPSVAEIEKCKDGKTPLKMPEDAWRRTGYRLPTEAEWEYACRGGSVTSRYYGSSEEMLPHHAWYNDNAQGRFWPVGQKKPNAFGLFDTHGNGWDWCDNCGERRAILREERRHIPLLAREIEEIWPRGGPPFPVLAPKVRRGQDDEQVRRGQDDKNEPRYGRAYRGSTFNSPPGGVRSAARGFRNPGDRPPGGFRVARTHH